MTRVWRRICGGALALMVTLSLGAIAEQVRAATLAEELRNLADEHQIIIKGLDKTEGVAAPDIDGTLDERLKGLLKEYNYILIQSVGGGPERVVIMHRIGGSIGGPLHPIPTVTRGNRGSLPAKPAVWTGDTKELLNMVAGSKISSGFGMRFHPILGYNVMHRGIDLAAGRGTPIKALADGMIDWMGRNGAYGNYLRIRHNGVYQTAYGHLSRFADGIKKGSRVKRGDIIGFVGSTGRSTGPHLHFELMAHGKRVNPMAELETFREAVILHDAESLFQKSTAAKLIKVNRFGSSGKN